jgi:hypothetical protein
MDWIDLAQDSDRWRALVNAILNLRFPENAGNFLTSGEPVSVSRRTLLRGVGESEPVVGPVLFQLPKQRTDLHETFCNRYAIGGQSDMFFRFVF